MTTPTEPSRPGENRPDVLEVQGTVALLLDQVEKRQFLNALSYANELTAFLLRRLSEVLKGKP